MVKKSHHAKYPEESDHQSALEGLAFSVVERAVLDANGTNLGRKEDLLAAYDACDFLVNRLWERDNIWGQVVKERVSSAARQMMQQKYGLRLRHLEAKRCTFKP